MLSNDKISHMTHMLLKGLLEKGVISIKEEESVVRKEIKKTISNELKAGEDLDEAVRRKLHSLSKKLIEGSNEWEVLYKKYFEEEELKKGKR